MRYFCNSYKLLRVIVTLCLGECVSFTNLQKDVVLSFFFYVSEMVGGRGLMLSSQNIYVL